MQMKREVEGERERERERERDDGRQKGSLRPRFGVWRLVKAAGVYSSTRCLVLIADAAALATCVECHRIARQGVIDVSEIELRHGVGTYTAH